MNETMPRPRYIALSGWEEVGRLKVVTLTDLEWQLSPEFSGGMFSIQDEIFLNELCVEIEEEAGGQWIAQVQLHGRQLLSDELVKYWLCRLNDPAI